jgi:hypothetical protein
MARLMCDVDMAEEAELRRLEGGGSPREPVVPAPSPSPPSCASFGFAEGEDRVLERVLASPVLAVKAGRERGLSVTARKQKAEAEQIAAEEAAAAAKRDKKLRKREAETEQNAAEEAAPSYELADNSLPNGVGILGRGRAAVNMPLRADGDGVQALQERRQSLLAKADFRPMRAVISVAPAGAGKFDGMPDRDDYEDGPDGEAAWARERKRNWKGSATPPSAPKAPRHKGRPPSTT